MDLEHVARNGHVAGREDAQVAVRVACRHDAALDPAVRRPGNVEDARFRGADRADGGVAVSHLQNLVDYRHDLAADQIAFAPNSGIESSFRLRAR